MTVSTAESRVQFEADGTTTDFPFNFLVLAKDDILVFETNTTGAALDGIAPNGTQQAVRGTDFTVTLNSPGGTVSFAAAPSDGIVVTLQRSTSPLQEIDYVPNDPFPAETHESGLDRAALRDQEIREDVARALKYQTGDDLTINTELPLAGERVDRVLGFNSTGAPIAVTALSTDQVTVSSFAETLLDDADATEARETLGVTGLADVFGLTEGTGDAYTLDLAQGLSQSNGTFLAFEAHTFSLANATLDFNGNGPQPIEVVDAINGGSDGRRPVAEGELFAGGHYTVVFNASVPSWVLLSNVSAGVTTQDIALKTQGNTFATLQKVSQDQADSSNGWAVEGGFADAHDFRLVQRQAGVFAIRDQTLAVDVLTYDSNLDTVRTKRDTVVEKDLTVQGSLTTGGPVPFMVESPLFAINTGTIISWSHGQGVIPIYAKVYLENVTAELGFNPGERTEFRVFFDGDTQGPVAWTDTEVSLTVANNEFTILPRDSGGSLTFQFITLSNWNLRFIAFFGS